MTDNNKKETARTLALGSLVALERDGRYSNLEIDSALRKADLNESDRGLYTRLVYGVTERRITLDHIISQYSSKPVSELDSDVLTALRLGVYQLLWMDRIPDHSAVDESVGLVSRQKRGFVNGVLRSFLRGNKEYKLPDKSDYPLYLSVKYSVPAPLARMFMECTDDVEALLEAMNREPHIGLRVNRLKISPEVAARMTGGRISKIAPDVVIVDSLDERAKDGLRDGLWFVQDEASRITSASVGATAGELIMDTCSCPGGKSFSMAIDMGNEGTVRSYDLHKNKLSLVRSGAEKLGITIITTEERDARKPDPNYFGKADRVLCDAPCSGLGVIAKKPDIRYKDMGDIERLPEIQYGVLCGAAEYVKNGGVLVYSTCTINKAENEAVVTRFLLEHPEFSLDENEFLPGGERTFMPHIDGCDGFFAARMKKNT
ncbi:MAG: 16S rRNA (cytosine(967)-C(5))-methyltransferase RsmB [Ruminococcaceae bacterium]|nr:16S rRNA (cytosine(967)-C(5))-methyltransferase RsmB [Oscillospiraceae bacterium]